MSPRDSRAAYVDHLMQHVVAPGGRLIIGVHNLAHDDQLSEELAGWGIRVAGVSRRQHTEPAVAYTVHWVEALPEA